MIQFHGMAYATDKVDRAAFCKYQYNSKIVYIGDEDPDVSRALNGEVIYASILTPPYDAFQAVLNDDVLMFSNSYTAHLNNYEPQMMLATIVASLYRGVNIVLLFPEDTGDLKYPEFLLRFIFANLGIQVGSDEMPFAYNNAFDDTVMDFLYMYNYVSPYEYVYMINNVSPASLQKLIDQLQIKVLNPNDINEYLNYIQGMHDTMVKTNTVATTTMFTCDPSQYKE